MVGALLTFDANINFARDICSKDKQVQEVKKRCCGKVKSGRVVKKCFLVFKRRLNFY